MRKLYCFDFDGTLTTKDSLFLFLKHCKPKQYNGIMLKYLPLFILLKLKFADAEKVKIQLVNEFLMGKSKTELEQKAKEFFEKNHQKILRPKALAYIQNLDAQQNKLLLVTASLDIWVKPFADYLGLKLIATKIHFENGLFTGKLGSKNCNKLEKVKRIKNEIKDENFDKTIAFGDSSGDTAMLEWANNQYFRFFH